MYFASRKQRLVKSGWLPNGITGFLLTAITVNFAFQGTELIGMGWISITASQLAFRKEYVAQGGKVADLKFKTSYFKAVKLNYNN